MPWYFYLLQFVSGLFLANGVPHFVQGISGNRFQSPFATPPGVGESSPLINALWGYANLRSARCFFGSSSLAEIARWSGWILVGLGILMMAVMLSTHFGKVRSHTS